MTRRGALDAFWPRAGLVAVGAAAGYLWHRRQRAVAGRARYRQLVSGEARGPRVVIVGGGFAGLTAASDLGRAGIHGEEVMPILVDRNDFHLFSPLLYQVATGGVEPGHITYPMRFVARDGGFLFRESELRHVDFERKRLDLDDGELSYDYLILALGNVPNYFGLADVQRHTLPLKWSGDAIAIHNRIIDAFERADVETDPTRRQELLRFVVVGGGATGVELVGSLWDLIHHTLLPHYPSIRPAEVHLMLVEGRDSLLPGIDSRMAAIAERRLRKWHVDVALGTIVAGASEGAIRTRDGTIIRAYTVIWTAGVKAPPLTERVPAPRTRDGRLQVNEYLEIPGHPDVYAVGDLAHFLDPRTGRPLPWNAPAAIQQGRTAAANVLRRIHGRKPEPFVYRSSGDLVSLGRTRAIADLFGVVFDGFPAWVARRTIYLVNLVGFKNRLDVLIDWAADFFYRQNAARIEVPRAEREMAAQPQLPASPGRQSGESGSEERASREQDRPAA